MFFLMTKDKTLSCFYMLVSHCTFSGVSCEAKQSSQTSSVVRVCIGDSETILSVQGLRWDCVVHALCFLLWPPL